MKLINSYINFLYEKEDCIKKIKDLDEDNIEEIDSIKIPTFKPPKMSGSGDTSGGFKMPVPVSGVRG